MELVKELWRKITPTKALEQSCGKLEKDFFESVYRVIYFVGQSSLEDNTVYMLYGTLVKFMITFVITGEIWYGFTEAKGLDGVVATVNVVVLQIITVYRYKSMIDNKEFYKILATSTDSPHFDVSTKERCSLVNTWAQKNETNLKLLLALGNCTLLAWFIFPLVDDLEYNLMIAIRLPFYYETPERYPFAYMLVMISFAYVAQFVMMTALILQAHLIHLLCRFSVLADCFESLMDDCCIGFEGFTRNELIYEKKFVDKYRARLGELVEQHKLILSHTMHLRSILSAPMLGQLAASGTLICFVAYQTASTIKETIAKGLMSFLFLGYNIFELYIMCHWCEEITFWSQKISEAVYFSGWENGAGDIPGVKSTLLFIIARANKPLVFTAGGMYSLSIAAYGSLLKASYSALTVLLRLD